jgi:uncharacterized protein (UPF0262 family)
MSAASPDDDAISVGNRQRVVAIVLDARSIGRNLPAVEQERDIAIFDLIERNHFSVVGHDKGPYRLDLGIIDDRLTFTVAGEDGANVATFMLSLTPFRRVVKDYFAICDSYLEAIRGAPPSRIEAIDMGRRSVHDDGSRLLIERLKDKVDIDFATSRRLFTLICALRWKG